MRAAADVDNISQPARSGFQFRQTQKAIWREGPISGLTMGNSQPDTTTGTTTGSCQSIWVWIATVNSLPVGDWLGNGAGSRSLGAEVHWQPVPLGSQQLRFAGWGEQQVPVELQQLVVFGAGAQHVSGVSFTSTEQAQPVRRGGRKPSANTNRAKMTPRAARNVRRILMHSFSQVAAGWQEEFRQPEA